MGSNSDGRIAELEQRLNDFRPEVRSEALGELAGLAEGGAIALPEPDEVANMHCHTFFSFNAYGHSPASLAWLARRRGYKLMGTVDFDVLDGAGEFLRGCDLAGVRGSVGMETRVFVPEFARREINSPGEPGVSYHMGIGFAASQVPAEVAPILADLRERAAKRNREMMARINAYLDPLRIDYERDVLPLTPAGNATERHMLVAYMRAAQVQGDPGAFWAEKLRMPLEQIAPLLGDAPKLSNLIRAKLMKRGGAGYVQPEAGSFPQAEAVHRLIVACGALPCATWLDGTSAGEQAMAELLELWIGKGVVALNVIPDRNWNIADPEVKRAKLRNLYEVVELAGRLDLPLIAGTEMNSYGQKLVDDFAAEELRPVRGALLDGAYFVYGHTVLQRALGLGYQSAWARAHLPGRRARNAFYTQVGRRVVPGQAGLAHLRSMGASPTPAQLLANL